MLRIRHSPQPTFLLGRRRLSLLLPLTVCLLLATTTVCASEDSDLRPFTKESVLSGKLNGVGMVIAGPNGSTLSIATGFLISPCHILTAGHALAAAGSKIKIGTPVKFLPKGQYGNAPVEPLWGRIVAADPDFVMNEHPPAFDLQAIARDWGLIELDAPVTEPVPLKLIYPGSRIPADTLYSIIGYPFGGRQTTMYAQEHCRNWSSNHGGIETTGVIIADCAVRQGMSGGPLLIEGTPQPLAAGIVVERVDMNRKVMTIAVPSHVFAAKIINVMRNSDTCAAGSPFALPPNPQP